MIQAAAIFILFFLPHVFCIAGEPSDMDREIDQRSFTLGGLSTLAEMIRAGVKTLALKKRKSELVEAGSYTGEARKDIPGSSAGCSATPTPISKN